MAGQSYSVFIDETGDEGRSDPIDKAGKTIGTDGRAFAVIAFVVNDDGYLKVKRAFDAIVAKHTPKGLDREPVHRREILSSPKDGDSKFLRSLKRRKNSFFRDVRSLVAGDLFRKNALFFCWVCDAVEWSEFLGNRKIFPYEVLLSNLMKKISGYLEKKASSATVFIERYNKDFKNNNLHVNEHKCRGKTQIVKFVSMRKVNISNETNPWDVDVERIFGKGGKSVFSVTKDEHIQGIEIVDMIAPEVLRSSLVVLEKIRPRTKLSKDKKKLDVSLRTYLFHRRSSTDGLKSSIEDPNYSSKIKRVGVGWESIKRR